MFHKKFVYSWIIEIDFFFLHRFVSYIKFVYLLFIILFLNYCDIIFCEKTIWIQCDAFLEYFLLSYLDSGFSFRMKHMDRALVRQYNCQDSSTFQVFCRHTVSKTFNKKIRLEFPFKNSNEFSGKSKASKRALTHLKWYKYPK